MTTNTNNRERSANISYIPRRLPSARLQGIPAPYVRTSLSPDRVLRRRARRRPSTSDDSIIEISSESDDEGTTSTCSLSSHQPTAPVSNVPEVIDLTGSPSTPPPEIPQNALSESSAGTSVSPHLDARFLASEGDDASSIRTYPVSSGRRPPWLRAALGKLYTRHQGFRCECGECDDGQMIIISTGPGRTIANFMQHVNSAH